MASRSITIAALVLAIWLGCATTALTQQWTLLNPLPTSEDLRTCTYPFPDLQFAAGSATILKSTDSGATWTHPDTMPCTSASVELHFFSQQNGLAMGYGSIDRTIDGGQSWLTVKSFSPYSMYDLFFLNDTLGWACGSGTTVFRTTDAGVTWEALVQSFSSADFLAIGFINPDTGYASGTKGPIGLLRKTTDGGSTWTDIPVPSITENLDHLYVVSDQELWVTERDMVLYNDTVRALLFHSTNGGLFWDTVPLPGYSGNIRDMVFLSPDEIRVLVLNALWTSHDGGATWTVSLISETPGLAVFTYQMAWLDEEHGIVVGHDGLIFTTTDGGASWENRSAGFRDYLWDVWFTDDQTGFLAVGNSTNYALLKSTNGGYSWEPKPVEPGPVMTYLSRVRFRDPQHGWAFGSVLYRSDDAGESWQTASFPDSTQLLCMAFTSPGHLWMGCDKATLMHSPDDGLTWQKTVFPLPDPTEAVVDICFPDAQTGYLLTGDYSAYAPYGYQLFKTTDGGQSWTQIPYPGAPKAITSLSFPDASTGYIYTYGDGLHKTTDGGTTWISIESPLDQRPSCVRFFTPDEGIFVFGRTVLATTTDGGVTWTIPVNNPCYVSSGRTFFFRDPNIGWQVGPGGMLFRYDRFPVGTPDEFTPGETGSPLHLYPNPVQEILTISAGEPILRVSLTDRTGRICRLVEGTDIRTITVSGLPAGLFTVQAITAETILIGTVVIVR